MAVENGPPGDPAKKADAPRSHDGEFHPVKELQRLAHQLIAKVPTRFKGAVTLVLVLVSALGIVVPSLLSIAPERLRERLMARAFSLDDVSQSLTSPLAKTVMVDIPSATFIAGSTSAEVQAVYDRCVDAWGTAVCVREPFEREAAFHAERAVSAFRIDATEVTNAMFLAWLDRKVPSYTVVRRGGSHTSPQWVVLDGNAAAHPLARLHTEGDPLASASGLILAADRVSLRPGSEALPVVHVSWFAAEAFCHDEHKRLPTEVQWELAARGTTRREYPWGHTEPACDDVAYGRGSRPWFDVDGPCRGPWPTSPDPVKSRPTDRTPEGIYDMGGNVAEWVEDRFAPEREAHIVRGGSWTDPLPWLRAASRSRRAPDQMFGNIGFRCATEATGRP